MSMNTDDEDDAFAELDAQFEGPKAQLDMDDTEDFLDIVDDDGDGDVDAGGGIADDEPDTPKGTSRSQRRFDQLTRKASEADRRAEAAEAREQATNERLEALEQTSNTNRMKNFKGEYDETRAALRQAMEEGDTDAQLAHTEKLASMRATAAVMDDRRRNEVEVGAETETMTSNSDAPPPKAMEWWGKNQWFNSEENRAETAYARQVDANIEAEGYDKNSPEYYEELDKRLQSKFPELYNDPAPGKQTRRKTPATAPSKGNAGSGQPKDGRIRFSREEFNMAKSLGLTSKEELAAYRKEIDTLNAKDK